MVFANGRRAGTPALGPAGRLFVRPRRARRNCLARTSRGTRTRERSWSGKREYKKHGFSGRYGILSVGAAANVWPRSFYRPALSVPPSFSFTQAAHTAFFFLPPPLVRSSISLVPHVGGMNERMSSLRDECARKKLYEGHGYVTLGIQVF